MANSLGGLDHDERIAVSNNGAVNDHNLTDGGADLGLDGRAICDSFGDNHMTHGTQW